MTKTIFGAENFINNNLSILKNQNIALLSNQSSIVFDKFSIFEQLLKKGIKINKVFFPQHGFFLDKQDNMKESGNFLFNNIKFISLYGDKLSPLEEDINDIDIIIYDLQDTGTRIYTFISTLYLLLKKLNNKDIKLIILDRPNPLSGLLTEGNIVETDFLSFVGIYPLPMVYGLTPAELSQFFISKDKLNINLEIINMENWNRDMFFEETGRFWYPPSPNMPYSDTTIVYPTTVLLEGTNLSEGRGTTRPFEIIGAPFMESFKLSEELNSLNLDGVNFIPYSFTPVFNKFSEEYCGGVFININNKKIYKPYQTGIMILKKIKEIYGDNFKWTKPPYEYEYNKLPIDIITGTDKIRKFIDGEINLDIKHFTELSADYNNSIKNFFLYS
jgi:uncharacterized protein YbbC (DUF1343 family)